MELAQNIQLPGGQTITGPLPASAGFTNLASVVTKAINQIVFPVAGIILLLYLVWGGFDYLTSMGDPKKAESGKNKITNAILGFVIIFVAFWIVQLVDYIFKLKVYTP
jgi:TRAP-type C4-dicarboxylate transport system permease small subunit